MNVIPEPPPSPGAPPVPVRIGRLVLGVLVVLVGIGWLLEVSDVADFAWDVILPIALIVIGGALLLVARSAAGHGGLIAAGLVLTFVLVLGSALDFPIEGGIGQRVYDPTASADIRSEYRHGIGELTLDLAGVSLPAATERVRVRLGIGRLLVIVPEDAAVRVRARATLGQVQVFGEEASGVDAERVVEADGTPLLDLELSVGLGQVEVRRG